MHSEPSGTERRRCAAFASAMRAMVASMSCCVLLFACSSDSLSPLEPEAHHAGAFVAVRRAEGQPLLLMRTLSAVRIEGDTILFLTIYDVTPADFEEAREIAQRRDIPIRQKLHPDSAQLLARSPHRVVWFRTLTREEEDFRH